jgi:hypothetical protein
MRRGRSGFVRVPLLVLAGSLLVQAPLFAQRTGPPLATAPANMGGTVHTGPTPTPILPGSSKTYTPTVHTPPRQGGPPKIWPDKVPTHPTGNGSNRDGNHGEHHPPAYTGYPWLAYGYSVPLAYSMPFAGDGGVTEGASPMPQQQADGTPVDYGEEFPSAGLAENGESSFRPPYDGSSQSPHGPYEGPPLAPAQAAPVHAQPTTVLIFKDGRPPQKVHNYALTGSTLYALDGDLREEIPLALLDLPATVETNRAAGVDFSLPVSR